MGFGRLQMEVNTLPHQLCTLQVLGGARESSCMPRAVVR